MPLFLLAENQLVDIECFSMWNAPNPSSVVVEKTMILLAVLPIGLVA